MSREITTRESTSRLRNGAEPRSRSSARATDTSALSVELAMRTASGVSRSGERIFSVAMSNPATNSTTAIRVQPVIFATVAKICRLFLVSVISVK